MESKEIIFLLIQALLFGTLLFIVVYIKQLPKTLQEKTLKTFQHSLNEKLELLKISQTELQTLKRNEFMRYSEYWHKTFENPKLLSNDKHVKELNSIGLNYFYFANDEVVKKFVELRKHLLYANQEEQSFRKSALVSCQDDIVG